MNLMCIDELIDSGMDSMGVENALAVLKKMHREQSKNILLHFSQRRIDRACK